MTSNDRDDDDGKKGDDDDDATWSRSSPAATRLLVVEVIEEYGPLIVFGATPAAPVNVVVVIRFVVIAGAATD